MSAFLYRFFPRFMTRSYVLQPDDKEIDGKPVYRVIVMDKTYIPRKGDLVHQVSFFNFFGIPIFITHQVVPAKK